MWSMGDPDLTFATFKVSTDDSGDIVGSGSCCTDGWDITLQGLPSIIISGGGTRATQIRTRNVTAGAFDLSQWITVEPDGFVAAENTDSPGTWTVVPEPTTLSLSALGLLALAAAQSRRGAA